MRPECGARWPLAVFNRISSPSITAGSCIIAKAHIRGSIATSRVSSAEKQAAKAFRFAECESPYA